MALAPASRQNSREAEQAPELVEPSPSPQPQQTPEMQLASAEHSESAETPELQAPPAPLAMPAECVAEMRVKYVPANVQDERAEVDEVPETQNAPEVANATEDTKERQISTAALPEPQTDTAVPASVEKAAQTTEPHEAAETAERAENVEETEPAVKQTELRRSELEPEPEPETHALTESGVRFQEFEGGARNAQNAQNVQSAHNSRSSHTKQELPTPRKREDQENRNRCPKSTDALSQQPITSPVSAKSARAARIQPGEAGMDAFRAQVQTLI